MAGKGWGLLALGVAVALAVYLAAKATEGPKPGEAGGAPKSGPDAPPTSSGAIFGEFSIPHGLAQLDLPYFGPAFWHAQVRLWNTNPSVPVNATVFIRTRWNDGAVEETSSLGAVVLEPGKPQVIDYDVPTDMHPSIFGRNRATAELVARLTMAGGLPEEIHLASVFFSTT